MGATSFVDAKQIDCNYVLTQGFGGFFVSAGLSVSHKKDDKTAAHSDYAGEPDTWQRLD